MSNVAVNLTYRANISKKSAPITDLP
jgi:hypothetical protein